jgi:spermidine synthase
MMTHVPLFAHGNAREILVIGGGDCGIAEEVLKHRSVERLTQVEIDASVVEFSQQHFPELTAPVLSDRRFDLIIDDGMKFAAETDRRFDIIIVDSTDPQGPGAVLFTREFYAACKRCLNPGGVMVTQNGVPFLQPDELIGSVRHFRALFADAGCYLAPVPTYIGGHMAMGWATDDPGLRRVPAEILAERYLAAGQFATRYWTPEVQHAAFALPRFIAEQVARAGA